MLTGDPVSIRALVTDPHITSQYWSLGQRATVNPIHPGHYSLDSLLH